LSPGGGGIYSKKCTEAIERKINCSVVSSCYDTNSRHHVKCPDSIAIGASGGASLKRFFYLWKGFPKFEGVIYTPTHHGLLGRDNQIVTILDLIPLRFPSQYRFAYYYFKYLLPSIMKKSLAVFTISNSVKYEIAEYYKYPLEKIYVVPCGVDQEKFCPSATRRILNKPYLLVIGAASYHKNTHEIFINSDKWKAKYRLKIIGSPLNGKYREYLQKVVEKYGLQEAVEFLGYLSDIEMIGLMQDCEALVYPSLCEGFGMPPLEVMACGRPVIVSDIPVHKELCGDVPIYITPGNQQSWGNAFSRLEDHLFIADRIAKGLNQIKPYTWQKSGEILIDTLLHLIPDLAEGVKNS
uniref:glycosyltransferase family 4 protein n=1 Tax=uncultured Thiodictyon sp. TaxID=1846217 RepID=UPI0025FFBB31